MTALNKSLARSLAETLIGAPRVFKGNFDGVFGSYINTPSSGLNTLTGSIDMIVYASKQTWIGGSDNQGLVGKWVLAGGQRGFRFAVEQTGLLRLQSSTNGSGVSTNDSTVPVSIADGVAGWVRCAYNQVGGTITFFTSNDPQSTPFASVTWSQLGAVVAHVAVAGFATTASVEIGASDVGQQIAFDGTISLVKVLNGIGGSVAISFDPDLDVDQSLVAPGTFTDSDTGAVWTLNGNATIS